MNGIMKAGALFVGIALGAGIFSFIIFNKTRVLENTYEVRINNQIIIVDVVRSDKDREKGLSGRDLLGRNEGMLFEFSQSDLVTFWMKDMKFPIDIVWIRDGLVLGYVEHVDPQIGVAESELIRYTSPEPVDRVLELSAGRAEQLHLFIGAEVNVRPLVQ